jgi:hypothetical protein
MSSPIKLCIHCTHWSPPEQSFQKPEEFSRCAAGGKVNLVTGAPIAGFCDINRANHGICGPEALLYVPKKYFAKSVEVTHE